RQPAAGEPELGLGQQLEHGAGHLLASDDPDHHHHHHHHDDSGADDHHHHDHDAAGHDDIDSHDADHELHDDDHARGGLRQPDRAPGPGGDLQRHDERRESAGRQLRQLGHLARAGLPVDALGPGHGDHRHRRRGH